MNADDFVGKIGLCVNAIAELKKAGWVDERIAIWMEPRTISRLANPGSPQKDPILDLYARYDVSNYAAGSVYLNRPMLLASIDLEPFHSLGYELLGSDETEFLVSDAEGKVVSVEVDDLSCVASFYASNTSKFLDALAHASSFIPPKLPKGDNLWVESCDVDENRSAVANRAEECLSLGGIVNIDINPYEFMLPSFIQRK